MAKKEIHELSYDELVLYEKELSEELSKVKVRKNQYKKLNSHTDLLGKSSSQTSSEEK